MGHYDGTKLPLWHDRARNTCSPTISSWARSAARSSTTSALICACAPNYPNADKSPAKPTDRRGRGRRRHADARRPIRRSRRSTASRSSSATADLTPDFYAVNTMQPPYQPSANKPAAGRRSAPSPIPSAPTTLPPQTRRRPSATCSAAKGVSLGLVRRRLAGGARRQERDAGAELPVPPPAVQLLRRLRAGHRGARRAPARTAAWTASSSSRRSTPASCRRSPSTSRRAISTSTPATPTSLSGDAAHRRRDRPSGEEPAVGAHAGRRHLRRERRLLGSCRAAQGRPLGPGHRAFRRSSSRRSPRRASSTTRCTTRPRSCASSPSASTCRCLPGLAARDAALKANGEPPMGDLTDALTF